MDDSTKAVLYPMGLFVGAVVVDSLISQNLPWNLTSPLSIIVFFASIGFFQKWFLSGDRWRQETSFANVHLYLKRRHFITGTMGRWYLPPGIGSKLFGLFTYGGMYSGDDGDMHFNLATIGSGERRTRRSLRASNSNQ
jgi:hypothetical protein